MSDPVTPHEIREDLLCSNGVLADDYIYVQAGGDFFIQHLDNEGVPIGVQVLTFNIGKYTAVAT